MLILFDIIAIAGVWTIVDSLRVPTAQLSPAILSQETYYTPVNTVSVRIEIYNSGSVAAYNVTMVIEIHGSTVSHHMNVLLTTKKVLLGNIDQGNYAEYQYDIPYPSEYELPDVNEPVNKAWAVLGEISWNNQGSGFKVDAIWITTLGLGAAAVLIIFNVYYARKLGFFRWLAEKKKPIIIVLLWSLGIAVVEIIPYWRVYAENPVLFEFKIAWTQTVNLTPHISILDLIVILAMSLIAGILLIDVETVVYSLIANFALSFVFAVVYSTLFIWFSLGYNEVFALQGGFLEWGSYISYIAARNIFRLIFPMVQIFCLLGAMLGAFVRGRIQPSAGQYV